MTGTTARRNTALTYQSRCDILRKSSCGSSSVVEHHLAKVGVASSSLVFRSISFGKLLFLNSSVGRASPCQGGGREFESRFPLHIWRHSQAVRQRSAKPSSPVRFWVPPPYFHLSSCRGGGTGRRNGLKIRRIEISVPVRFRSPAPKKQRACERRWPWPTSPLQKKGAVLGQLLFAVQ